MDPLKSELPPILLCLGGTTRSNVDCKNTKLKRCIGKPLKRASLNSSAVLASLFICACVTVATADIQEARSHGKQRWTVF